MIYFANGYCCEMIYLLIIFIGHVFQAAAACGRLYYARFIHSCLKIIKPINVFSESESAYNKTRPTVRLESDHWCQVYADWHWLSGIHCSKPSGEGKWCSHNRPPGTGCMGWGGLYSNSHIEQWHEPLHREDGFYHGRPQIQNHHKPIHLRYLQRVVIS